jgi:hypothetical protein
MQMKLCEPSESEQSEPDADRVASTPRRGAAIVLEHVSKRFAEVRAVQDCSLRVPGRCVCISTWAEWVREDDAIAHDWRL